MSVANASWESGPGSQPPDRMPGAIALSAALHILVFALVILGLPSLFHERVPANAPIAVNLVHIGPHTRATRRNREMPHRHASLKKPIPGPPVPKPQVKPAPPTPAPPPSAAAPKPAPAPPKAKPLPKPAPPKPKPMPKLPEKTVEAPPPPLPQAKPMPPPEPLPPPLKALAQVVPPVPKVKPRPPRVLVKEERRSEQKRYNPALFETLLKNLAKDESVPSEEARPRPEAALAGRASSQPKAPLGGQLSASEIDLIRNQIARCWDIPAGARDAKNLVVEIRVSVNPDGTVRRATIVDQARLASDPVFRSAAESARRALFDPQCMPLHLPADQYPLWKDMDLSFSPKDIL